MVHGCQLVTYGFMLHTPWFIANVNLLYDARARVQGRFLPWFIAMGNNGLCNCPGIWSLACRWWLIKFWHQTCCGPDPSDLWNYLGDLEFWRLHRLISGSVQRSTALPASAECRLPTRVQACNPAASPKPCSLQQHSTGELPSSDKNALQNKKKSYPFLRGGNHMS